VSTFRFQVITLFPEMVQASMSAGVFAQALKKGLLELSTINPRDFTTDVHRTVDDRPFGGGDGMIMLAEPLEAAIAKAKAVQAAKVVYLSPHGTPLTHEKARALSAEPGLILLCGRYGGVDQRLLNACVDEEISTGDYVISGGELAACVLMDAVSRFVPEVLGHKESAEKDSFSHGLLEHPNFTRPREFQGQPVPEILLGGNHKAIDLWKQQVSVLTTLAKRPDLIWRLPEAKTRVATAKKFWLQMSPEEKSALGLNSLLESAFSGADEKGADDKI
jgi:tRNA (guanine37-N1)-methyltransferase